MKQSSIFNSLTEIYQKYLSISDGKVASYIPQLTKVNPDLFGICLCTSEGKIYAVGDYQVPFTIQSISKVFVYSLALMDLGVEKVLEKVGVEPSGMPYNSIVFDEINHRPHNPMINTGAIVTTSMIKGDSLEIRFHRILEFLSQLAGRNLLLDEGVYQSAKNTGYRNRAIAYLALNHNMIEEPIKEHFDLYCRQCSILITTQDLAIMSATLANYGINPITKKQVIESHLIKPIVSVMSSCGMYNFSGQWLFDVGLPAKSGVGGGIMAVLPRKLGISVFSPRLDSLGNSVRGILVCKELSQRFNLHLFDNDRSYELTTKNCHSEPVEESQNH